MYVIEKYERSLKKNNIINKCVYKGKYWWINKYMNIYILIRRKVIKSKCINKVFCIINSYMCNKY